MVKKALFAATFFFVLYAVFIAWVKPYWSISQHQWQDNQIKGERFLYNEKRAQSVVVGSSLACRLDPLPGVYNLALSGQSPLDGLALVTWQPRPLRRVYVEMNILERAADRNFTEALTNPILSPLKHRILALRADKQPLAVVGERVQMKLEPLLARFTVPGGGVGANPGALFNKMLANQIRDYALAPAPDFLQQQFALLKDYVVTLEQRGTQVVFFEMPVDPHLCNSAKANAIRTTFRHYFPETKYRYVAMPECGQYQTMDGVHLNSESATRYTRYLQAQL